MPRLAMARFLREVGLFAAACLLGELFVEAASLGFTDPAATFGSVASEATVFAEHLETAEAPEDITRDVRASTALNRGLQVKRRAGVLLAAFLLIAVAIAGVPYAVLARKKPPVEKLRQKYDAAVEQLAQARDDARRLGLGLSVSFEDVIDTYEEHFETVARRFRQAVDSASASGFFDAYTVGRLKGSFLKSTKTLEPTVLEELWANVQPHIDGEVSEDKIPALKSVSQELLDKANEFLDITRHESGQLLRSVRDETLRKLEKHERMPGSVSTADGEPIGNTSVSNAQEFLHTVSMIFNRESTIRPCRKAIDSLESGLDQYAQSVQRVARLSARVAALKSKLAKAEKDTK